MIIESLYQGREQTQVKHKILERYLSAFAPIIGTWASDIAYIDCLAGPWEARGPKLEDTSFSIAIDVLRTAKANLRSRAKPSFPSFRCLLIESDARRFARLNQFAKGVVDIETRTEQWDFGRHIGDVVSFAKERTNSFPFFFIDPTGWELIAIDLIKPILALEPGEVLINLMTSWIKRFLSDESKNFERLLGPDTGRIRQLSGEEQEEELVRCYAAAVKRAGKFDYVCTLPILKAESDAFHFWMIYGTRHEKGVEEFKKTEKDVIPYMHETRAEAQKRERLHKTGQLDLLEPAATYYEKRLTRLEEKNRQMAKDALLDAIQRKRNILFDDAWAESMQFALVKDTDFRGWIQEWIKAGKMKVTLSPGERSPKRGSGHVLTWVDTSPEVVTRASKSTTESGCQE